MTHGSLLVRSPRGPHADKNIDIVFVGVEFLSSPGYMNGLDLDHGAQGDSARAAAEFGNVDPKNVYVLVSAGRRHLVVAAAYEIREHEGDIFESPFKDEERAP